MAPSPAIARVVDFETTGLPEDEGAAICEAARIDVNLIPPDFPVDADSAWSSLVNPGVPIPPEISAVHHIVADDLVGAPNLELALRALEARMTEADVYVAHNAIFEQHFFKRPNPWICTYKCALRAWPGAPGHGNQVLRYWLGVDVDREKAQPPHRALPDCYVTAQILRKLLFLRPVERLIEISKEPGFLPKLTFGKHRGTAFAEAPEDYLRWLVAHPDMDEDVVFTANWHLKRKAA